MMSMRASMRAGGAVWRGAGFRSAAAWPSQHFSTSPVRRDEDDDRQEEANTRGRMMPFAEFVHAEKTLNAKSTYAALPIGILGPQPGMPPPEIFGLPPDMFGGVVGLGGVVVSGIVGKIGFKLLWGLQNRELSDRIKERRNDFNRRIVENRCDDANPDTGADAMPKDDPYGSKVTTPLEYLYWLREQSQQRKSLDNADGEDSTYVNDEGK
eukprot:gene8238-9780_t